MKRLPPGSLHGEGPVPTESDFPSAPVPDPMGSGLGRILRIALPIVVSNASYTAMLFVDRLFLSRIGKHELAAAMSGGLTSFVLASFFVGLVGYVGALVAQYYGAEERGMCTRATTQALYVALASYPVMLLFLPLVRYVFVLAGQDSSLTAPATAYARILLLGSILLTVRTAFGSFFVGIGKTRMVMLANIVGTLVNAPLNYILIFGKLGFPALGIRGAALGTIGGGLVSLAVITGLYLKETSRAPYRVDAPLRYVPDLMRRLLRFGFPAGVEPFLNWFAFNIFVQVMHSYGPDTAAAATICFNYDAIAFIPMLGLGVAATTVAGQYIGAGNHDGAQRAVYLTARVSLSYALAMIVLFLGFAPFLVAVFSSGLGDTDGRIAVMAVAMLRLVTLYTFAIASKLVLSGALRAAGDTTWVMWVSVAIHWMAAVAVVILVRVVHAHPYVTWAMLVLMNNAHALAVYYRLRTGRWKTMRLIG